MGVGPKRTAASVSKARAANLERQLEETRQREEESRARVEEEKKKNEELEGKLADMQHRFMSFERALDSLAPGWKISNRDTEAGIYLILLELFSVVDLHI